MITVCIHYLIHSRDNLCGFEQFVKILETKVADTDSTDFITNELFHGLMFDAGDHQRKLDWSFQV